MPQIIWAQRVSRRNDLVRFACAASPTRGEPARAAGKTLNGLRVPKLMRQIKPHFHACVFAGKNPSGDILYPPLFTPDSWHGSTSRLTKETGAGRLRPFADCGCPAPLLIPAQGRRLSWQMHPNGRQWQTPSAPSLWTLLRRLNQDTPACRWAWRMRQPRCLPTI